MSVLAWIVLGGIAGWIGSLLVNKSGEGIFLDIVLGTSRDRGRSGSSPRWARLA